jgi:hypothetical protein
MESVCGHSFIVGCMWRGAAHESSFSVGCGAAHGSACGLAQRGMRAACGGLCMRRDQREGLTQRRSASRMLYSIELRMFHAFRFMFYLDVVCVLSECCMCFI